jgi:hypothetical protein
MPLRDTYNADGYHKDIVVMSDRQVHSTEVRVRGGMYGPVIDPSEFPEMVRFEVILENVY